MNALSQFIDVMTGVFITQFGRGIYAYITSAEVVALFEQCNAQKCDYEEFARRFAKQIQ